MNITAVTVAWACKIALGAQGLEAPGDRDFLSSRSAIAYLVDAPSPAGKQAVYAVSADGSRHVPLGPRNANVTFLGIEEKRVLIAVDHPDPDVSGVHSVLLNGGGRVQLTRNTEGSLRFLGTASGRAIFTGYDAANLPLLVSYPVAGGAALNLNPSGTYFMDTDLSRPQLLGGHLYVNTDYDFVSEVDLGGGGFRPFVTRQTAQYPLLPLQVTAGRVILTRNPYLSATELFSVLLDGSDLRVLFDGWDIGRPFTFGTRLIVETGLPPLGEPPNVAYYRQLAAVDVDGSNPRALSSRWLEDSGACVSLVGVAPAGYALYTDQEQGSVARLYSSALATGGQRPIYTFSSDGEGAMGACGVRVIIAETVSGRVALKSVRLDDGSSLRLLTPHEASDAFLRSIQGEALVLRTRGGRTALLRVMPDGRGTYTLLGSSFGPSLLMATSPRALAVLTRNHGRQQIYTIPWKGGRKLRVYDEPATPTAFRFLKEGTLDVEALP